MVTAIILAGGESSRLYPLGDKSLQRFMGQTLLARHLATLAADNITQAVVVTNPANDAAIRAECAMITAIAAHFVTQPAAAGMGDAVARAVAVCQPDEPVVITQAHDLLDPGFHSVLLTESMAHPDAIVIAARAVTSYFPGGYLIPVTHPDDSAAFAVRGIVEKPTPGTEPSNWVTLVAHVIPRAGDLAAALATTAGQDPGDWYERALSLLMARRGALAVPHRGPTASLKYPWQMLDCMELLLGRLRGEPLIDPGARIDPAARIQGAVVIAEGVRVFAGAIVQGPAYLGPGAIIGNNALVRETMFGARSVAGFGSEVARSWIGQDVWFHTSYVGDSVIDDRVTFGYGAVTSNLRLDNKPLKVTVKGQRIDTGRTKLGQIIGAGTRVGVTAALMPGSVIGRDCLIGPGVVLREDVPDATRILVKQELIREPQPPTDPTTSSSGH